MNYYKVTIQYEGTHYSGLQWQQGLKTVQDEFNKALAQLIEGKITTTSASRTDSGVHALMQIMKVTSSCAIDKEYFCIQINKLLPADIRSLKIENCASSFKPSVDSLSKEYRYLFTNKSKVSLTDMQFISNISNTLDFDEMKKCISMLKGIYDFQNFYSAGSNVKSTIRNIISCELTEINPHTIFENLELFKIPTSVDHCYELKIVANGFLKQMIRHLVSALWMVGSQKITSDEFQVFLSGPKVLKQRWKVAPPNGLFLFQIVYAPAK